jgi:hypothetical protein
MERNREMIDQTKTNCGHDPVFSGVKNLEKVNERIESH